MVNKIGIFYLTYDGVYNFTSGIGTQTLTLLKGLCDNISEWSKVFGEIELNIIVPEFDSTVYCYSEDRTLYIEEILSKLGGRILTCTSEPDSPDSKFWTITNWDRMCISSANIILGEVWKYDKILVIAVDPPFMLAPKYIEDKNRGNFDITSVITMYTSTYIHDFEILPDRLSWERNGLSSLEMYGSIKLADVCDFMTDHFRTLFDVSSASFVPFHSSLHLPSLTDVKRDQEQTRALLREYGIPLDVDIIFAFGRASWVKGFDTLLNAYSLVECSAHLVLLASEFIENQLESYNKLILDREIPCTLFTKFDRELPSILAQYERCKVVVCPSLREPFSNIPLEVALWAEQTGPVVIASNIGGFLEQIVDEKTGFLFRANDPVNLAEKIDLVLGLSEERHQQIRHNAAAKVNIERDFTANFGELLLAIWASDNVV